MKGWLAFFDLPIFEIDRGGAAKNADRDAEFAFFGVDLLEAARQWEPAARLASQIAQRPGDRATEARERATKIRLEHFLWDGPAPVTPKVLPLEDKIEEKNAPTEPTTKSKSKAIR